MKYSLFLCATAMLAAFFPVACSRPKPGPHAASGGSSPSALASAQAGPSGPKLSYSHVNVPGPYLAITFDDGPVPANTPRLLDMLQQRGIKATFFVVGNFAVSRPQIIRRIIADGHEIANHTWTHRALTSLSDSGVRSELRRSHDLVVKVTGPASAPRMFRPPGGAITARQKTWIMGEFGYPCILWSIDPRDWEAPSRGGCKGQPWELTRRIVSQAKSGDIVLVHDLHASSVDAMPATLDGLLAKGFRFVTMSQLIALGQGHMPNAGGLASASHIPLPPLYTPGSF